MIAESTHIEPSARTSAQHPDEAALITAAQAGDHAAFERLYRVYIGQVYGLCLRMVADTTTAETLAQDVFVRAWQKLGSYEARGAFGGWLRRLTVNLVIEDRRRLKRERRVWEHGIEVDKMDQGIAAAHRSPEQRTPAGVATAQPRATETAIVLERAIAALPPNARQVFVLHDVTGYRYREIAEIMGIALGTVKAHLHRARGLLRQELARSGEAICS